MASPKQEFYALLATLEPKVEAAFLNSVYNTTTAIPFAAVVAAFNAGDIERGIDLMELTPAAFAELNYSIAAAYQTAGASAARQMPNGITVKFDTGDAEIENFIRQNVGFKIREISEEARQLVRDEMTAAFARGDNPTRTVQGIVGKINRATGRREGGIIGLTKKQRGWVDNARAELENLDGSYFSRAARDKRSDKKVAKAIEENKPLTKTDVDSIVDRYKNGLLRERAKTIALTETMTAINSTKMMAFEKAANERKINLQWVDKIWRASGDGRVRHTHRAMSGQTVGFRDNFTSPSGARLNYPADPSAPAAERIRCRCWLQLRVNLKRKYGIDDDQERVV